MPRREILVSNSVKDTQKIAKNLAEKIMKTKLQKHSQVLGLEGELGAGKTVFVKGFAKALKIKGRINSPTFILMRHYKIPKSSIFQNLYHFDAYRLKNEKDLIAIGAKQILNNPKNIVLIEWSDRVKKLLPKNYIKIHIDHVGEKTRRIEITSK